MDEKKLRWTYKKDLHSSSPRLELKEVKDIVERNGLKTTWDARWSTFFKCSQGLKTNWKLKRGISLVRLTLTLLIYIFNLVIPKLGRCWNMLTPSSRDWSRHWIGRRSYGRINPKSDGSMLEIRMLLSFGL